MSGRHRSEGRDHARYLASLAVVGGLVAVLVWQLVMHPKLGHPAAVPPPSSTTAVSPPGSATAARSTAHSSAKPTHPTRTRTSTPPPDPAQVRAQVAAQVAALSADQPQGSISIAALNTATGAHYAAGESAGMWTASAYKLFVLETLLLLRQQEGETLSDDETAEATSMIENSDNKAGYDLFLEIGGNAALSSAASTFGMTHTVPGGSDPTFTTTGALDCLALLRNLVTKGPLDSDSRSFALGLMRDVEADQRWGVGVVADPGTRFANKNGWLSVEDSNGQDEQDDGRWITTSLGIVTVHGQQVLMAVLTQHQPSFDEGVQLVEQLAKAVVPAVS